MTPRHLELTLFVVIFFVLLVTGCSSPPNSGNIGDSSQQNATSVPANATIVQVQPVSTDNQLCTIIAKGDELNFAYESTKNISVKNVWLFSTNYALLTSIPVGENASSNFTLTTPTDTLPSGDYRLVIHFPGNGDSFDIRTNSSNTSQKAYGKDGGLLFDLKSVWSKKMTGFEAADILEREIHKPGMRDTSTGVNFTVQVPIIRINPIGDHHVGDVFEINGSTNIAAGNTITVQTFKETYIWISPRSYTNYNVAGFKGTAIIQDNQCGNNTWSVVANLSEIPQISDDEDWIVTAGSSKVSAFSSIFYKMLSTPPKPKITNFSVIQGDSFSHHGTAPAPAIDPEHAWMRIRDDPAYMTKMAVNEIRVWMFGEHYVNVTTVQANPDSTFNFTVNSIQTAGLPLGNYRILIQYPQYEDLFDIIIRDETGRVMNRHGDFLFNFADIRDSRMSGFTAADIFERELKKSDAKDRYETITLNVTDS